MFHDKAVQRHDGYSCERVCFDESHVGWSRALWLERWKGEDQLETTIRVTLDAAATEPWLEILFLG